MAIQRENNKSINEKQHYFRHPVKSIRAARQYQQERLNNQVKKLINDENAPDHSKQKTYVLILELLGLLALVVLLKIITGL